MIEPAEIKPKPLILNKTRDSITISCENLFGNLNSKLILQKLNCLKEWETILINKKSNFKIEYLAEGTCYNFRVKPHSVSENTNEEWIYFNAATDYTPFLTIHMTRAVKLGKMPLIRKIAQSRPELLEIQNKEYKTPLIQAVESGDIQIVHLLLTLGANVNTASLYNKRTPLMIAIYKNKLQIASILIDKGANVNAIDINGLNILHHAVDSNKIENVDFALNSLKPIDCQDNNGWSSLFRAVILQSSKEIIYRLLDKGANVNLADKNRIDYAKHTILN